MLVRSEVSAIITFSIVNKKFGALGDVTESRDIDPARSVERKLFLRRMHITICNAINNFKVSVGSCANSLKAVDVAESSRLLIKQHRTKYCVFSIFV